MENQNFVIFSFFIFLSFFFLWEKKIKYRRWTIKNVILLEQQLRTSKMKRHDDRVKLFRIRK